MQQEMIREIETARPKFLVFVNIRTSWLTRPGSKTMIFEWFQQYQDKYYQKVGIVDILSEQNTVYLWGRECKKYKPFSDYWLSIFRRKNYEHNNERHR
jgi:hypothetical protein